MAWSNKPSKDTIDEVATIEIEVSAPHTSDTALFVEDSGALPLETRRALIQLLSGPCLDGKRHAKLWTTLLKDEEVIRSRLSELFLDLIIDRGQEVAFTKQADTGELLVPMLLRRSPLTFLDSALLLYLRQHLSRADAHGERAVVEREEIVEQMSVYEKSANCDKVGFTKRLSASIEKFKKNNILQSIRSSPDRFEIVPTLKLLFSSDEILALTALYNRLAADGVPVAVEQPTAVEEDL